jgi:hypothetical protein
MLGEKMGVTPLALRRFAPFGPLQATITHTFPSKLKPGEEITGQITVTNTTSTDVRWKVEVTPDWDPAKKVATATTTIAAGASNTFSFPTDFSPAENLPYKMPNKTATLTISVLDEAGVEQGKTTATIELVWYYKQIFGIPLWILIIGGIVVLGGIAVAARKK